MNDTLKKSHFKRMYRSAKSGEGVDFQYEHS